MNKNVTPEILEVMEAVHYRPSVSIIMPFEPKMNLKKELTHSLQLAADKLEKELKQNYPNEMGNLVIHKLQDIFNNLNYNTHKKSIGIFVSPVFEKILYLDIPAEEKIILDESFEIRDLVYSKKQLHKYLVLLISGKESSIYLCNTESFVRLVLNKSQFLEDYINDAPERVANFSDMSDRKEILLEKFLQQIENGLNHILHA